MKEHTITIEKAAALCTIALVICQVGIAAYAICYALTNITPIMRPLYLKINWSGYFIACSELVPLTLALWLHARFRRLREEPGVPGSPQPEPEPTRMEISEGAVKEALEGRGIRVDSVSCKQGLFVARYFIHPSAGQRVAKIKAAFPMLHRIFSAEGMRLYCQDDAMVLEAHNGNRHGLIPGDLREEIEAIRNNPVHELPLVLGMAPDGSAAVIDLDSAQAVMIAGKAGRAASTLNSLIWSLRTFARGKARFALISGTAEALLPLDAGERFDSGADMCSPAEADRILKDVTREMERRAETISGQGAKDIWEQRHMEGGGPLPHLVVVMCGAEAFLSDREHGESIRKCLLRTALCGNKVGVHCIASISDLKYMEELMRVNFQTRIALRLSSRKESMRFLEAEGAECLRETGDALLYQIGDVSRFTPFDLDL